jgi:hypothetical protein
MPSAGRLMNANPQTAAEKVRKTYRDVRAQLSHLDLDAAVPDGVSAFAKKAMAQTSAALSSFSLNAFDESLTTFERSFGGAGKVLPHSTARSSTSSAAMLMRASS